jgi:transcription antitermination factor NusG
MTGEKLKLNWYAVCTRHQHEKAAAKILEYKEFEILLPVYKARRRWQDRVKEISVPLFPGYLFVKSGREGYLPILTTPGVSSIVGCGGRPATIPFSEIEGIRRIVQSTLRVEPHPFLRSGDRVRVKYGPIAGVEGILLRSKNVARLVLSVEMLGKSAAVEVDATHVERVSVGRFRADLDVQVNPIPAPTIGQTEISPA